MTEPVSTPFEWGKFEGHVGKLALAMLPIFFAFLTLPERYTEPLPYRLVILAGFLLAAFLLYSSGRRLKLSGDRSEAAARSAAALVTLLFAVWLSTPSAVLGNAAAADAREAVRSTIGLPVADLTLADRIEWSVEASDRSFAYVAEALETSLRTKGRRVAVGENARRARAAIAIDVRHVSAARGEYRVDARGAIRTNDLPQCQFVVTTPRPRALRSADEQLSDEIIRRVQSYIEGNDRC